MEDTPVVAPLNSLSHATTSTQPPFPDDSNDATHSDVPRASRRSVQMMACCSDTDDDEEDALRRGAFDYYVSTSKHVAAVAALGKPTEAKHLNDDAAKDDDVSLGDSPRSDCAVLFDDAKRRFDEEYELEAMDQNSLKARKANSRFKTIEDVCNAKTRANNDQQYDERYSVSSAGSTVHSDDEDDDNLVNVNVHERLRDSCYVTIDTDFGDDAMECIDQAKKMTITQPLNSSLSHLAQNYGSTGVHPRSQAVDAAVSFGALNRAADNATGFSHDLTVASGAANRVHVEKSTYSKRSSPPFGDPVCREKLTHSALQLLPQGQFQSHQMEPQSYKMDDAAECSAARKKKKKKKSTSSRGDEVDDGKSLRETDINGNPLSGPTKKQHSSGRRTDSGSSEPHSRSDMGYEYSDLSSQMSSSSDSRYLEKKAKKAKRERKDACTTQAKDIPGNRGDQDVEALLNYIENGKKKQRQVNGIAPLATAPLGGAVEQKFSVKKFGYGKGERTGADIDMDSKGSSVGSEGKTADVFTGSEGSSVSDSVTEIGSVNDTMPKDESVVCPVSGDTYIFTDFDCILPPKEAEFTQVKKKKKRPKDIVVPRESAWHAVCQVELHRKPHVSARSVTPPPALGVGSEEVHVERALSPSSFPVLGRSREGRRNSTGNAPPTDGLQDDSDMESVKSVPIGSELGGVLSPRLSHLAKQSYAKIAAASRPGVDNDAAHRAEQTHVVNPESQTASVTCAKDEDRHNVVITSDESVETLSVKNTKQRTDLGCSSAAALSQFSCVPSATVSSPVLSSVVNVPSCPVTDSVITSVTPDDTVTIMKRTAYISLAHIDAKDSCRQSSIVCNKSSFDDDPNLQAVSGMDSCQWTKSEASECDLHGSSIHPKSRALAMRGNDDNDSTAVQESVAVVFADESESLEMAPSHATAATVQLNDKHVIMDTHYSNKNVPQPLTSTGAAIDDVTVNIVNINVQSSKTLLPQNSIGVTPVSVGGCSRSAVPKASNIRRSKTNKSVIFFDKKLNELPQNLGISFGFGPEVISTEGSAKDSGTAGSCNDACVHERPEANSERREQPPRDSSHSLVADTMPSPQLRCGDATDVYMSKVLVPMNGVILPHTASLHQGASSSVVATCPEHVHLVNDSSMPSHPAKPGVGYAGQLYNRANDFNFQSGKFDIEGAVTFLYKEWEKITKQKPKRASRVIFYNDNECN